MLASTVDTGDHRPDPARRGAWWLSLPELRPWHWYVATVVCFAVAAQFDGWPGLIGLFVGLGCGLYGLTSYNQGQDGLNKYRQ